MKELLIPVGSYEALEYAVYNGCDAVYLAGKKYGARSYANNFTLEELKNAVSFCHLYDVKVYVAINIMIFEREFKEVIKYILYLNSINVDALIISDLGLISYLHQNYPKIVIHASTQAHTFNINQIKFLKELGVKRVVVDRELSIEEINCFENIMEIEVFIHGALCVCYSGNCLMSYLTKKRSGNRGCCAQNCRLPYQLKQNNKLVNLKDKYLLSTKELNTSYHIEELMKSNITSFKVEGRMKSPSYVGFITNFYRTLIDNYQKFGKVMISEEDIEKLKVIYNRDFTDGYLFNNQNIYNMKSPNHQGIILGKVIDFNKKIVKIKLFKDLNQEDGIRFVNENLGMIVNFLYDEKGKLINKAFKNDIVLIDNKLKIESLGEVRKTIDYQLEKTLQKTFKRTILIDVILNITLDNFIITVIDNKNKITMERKICEKALKVVTSKEEIIKQIKKTGDTPFTIGQIKILLEPNLFIPIKKINEIRRDVLEKLESVRRK